MRDMAGLMALPLSTESVKAIIRDGVRLRGESVADIMLPAPSLDSSSFSLDPPLRGVEPAAWRDCEASAASPDKSTKDSLRTGD